jgi:hypothetical protein
VGGRRNLHDVERQFHPFVVRKLQRPGRECHRQGGGLGQPAQELARDLAEVWGLAACVAKEGVDQSRPAPRAEDLATDGIAGEQETLEVVAQQFAVQAGAPRRHAGGSFASARIAQVAAES